MMKRIFALFLVSLCILSFAEEAGLLFRANFDSYFAAADYSVGQKMPLDFKNDLQLRMWAGIDGNGNALKLSPKECCTYPMQGNFDPKAGTLNLWLSVCDWKFNDEKFQMFFEAQCGTYRFILYKYWKTPLLTLVIVTEAGTFEADIKPVNVDWENQQWHMLTVTWEKEVARMYLDGKMPEDYAPGNAHPAFPRVKLAEDMKYPSDLSKGRFCLGNMGGRWSAGGSNAFDEVKIYGMPLSPERIQKLYESIRPRKNDAKLKYSASIPKLAKAPNLDGVINGDEWKGSVRIPMMTAYKIPNHRMPKDTWARACYDDKFLYLAFSTDMPKTRQNATKYDEAVYCDDSFEMFFRRKDNREVYASVNCNGAVFDKLDEDNGWNGNIKAAAKDQGKYWQAELAIPLEALGNPKAGDVLVSSMHTLNFASAPYYYMSWGNDPCEHAKNGLLRLAPAGEAVGSICDIRSIYGGNLSVNDENGCELEVKLDGEQVKPVGKIAAGSHVLQIQSGGNFEYGINFIVEKPIVINFDSYPSSQFVEVRVDLGNADDEVQKSLPNSMGRIAMVQGGKELSSVEFKPEALQYVKLPLPKNLASGMANIVVTVKALETLTAQAEFRVPDMTPYKLKVAKNHEVPEPWISISSLKRNHFRLLDREYVFNGSPFPGKMISRGKDVLASQPQLLLDGKPVSWSDFRQVEQHNDYRVFTGKGKVDGVELSWRGELWFDGLWKLDFSLAPQGVRKVGSLALEWNMAKESSRYFMGRNKEYVVFPWVNGKITNGLNLHEGSWLSGVVTGLFWQSLSSANFLLDKKPAVLVEQKPDCTSVRMNIIAREATLPGKLDYSFAFMATPVKRPQKDFRMYNMGNHNPVAHQNYVICSTGLNFSKGYKRRSDEMVGMSGHAVRFPEQFRKDYLQQFHYDRGIHAFPYHQPKGITQLDPEWDYFLAEWRTNPGYMQNGLNQDGKTFDYVHCCGEGIADLLAYRLNKMYEDFPELGGIYYDICDVKSCSNAAHGHGGKDAFGNSYSTSTVMSLRNYLMRIYKVSHSHHKEVFNHAHNYFNPVAHAYSDIWYPGENEVWLYGGNPDYYYCEAPLDEYQCAWNAEVRGCAIFRGTQVTRVATFLPAMKAISEKLNSFQQADRSLASVWVHDFNTCCDWIEHSAVERFWAKRAELNFGDVIFHGYWFDDSVTSASKGVLVSWYELHDVQWSKLIVLANMTRQAKTAALRGKLLEGVNEFTDVYTGKVYSRQDLETLQIPDNYYLLLGIK